MKIAMTEYLQIDLETERWECRVCGHDIESARGNYKEGLLVYARDPSEVHKPILDDAYEFTFAPDPKWVKIVEYYCPECASMMEVEYLTPGHPPLHDMEFDIDALKAQWQARGTQDTTELAGPEPAGVGYCPHPSAGPRGR